MIHVILRVMFSDGGVWDDDTDDHRAEGILVKDCITVKRLNLLACRRMDDGMIDREFDPPPLSWIDEHARVA